MTELRIGQWTSYEPREGHSIVWEVSSDMDTWCEVRRVTNERGVIHRWQDELASLNWPYVRVRDETK